MTVNDMINTAVELRAAIRLLDSDRADEAVEILRNVSSWLIEQAKDVSVASMREEWRRGDALLDSAMERLNRIKEAVK